MGKHSSSAVSAVFINCPFDPSYRPVFDAIVFAVMALGFEPRCALERDTGTQDRLKKIVEIIHSCQFGIHDLSFMRIDRSTKLPRYNMAFELGLFLGCCEFGGEGHKGKSCLILGPRTLAISKVAIGPQWSRHSGTQERPQASHHGCTKLARDGIAAV